MADQIQAGSVVQLKSGGPRMTVNFVEKGEAACTWFEGAKKMNSRFALTSLKLAE